MTNDQQFPRPEYVGTPLEFAEAMKALSRGRSYAVLGKQARDLGREMPKSTLSDLCTKGKTSEQTLDTFLTLCGVIGEERDRWVTAWQRSRGELGSVRVTPETGGVEAAPDHLAEIEAWLTRHERELRDPSVTTQARLNDLVRVAESSLSLFTEVSRLVNSLPDKPSGTTDPVAFGRWVADAVGMAAAHLQKMPEAINGASAPPDQEALQHDVTVYIEKARRTLIARAHSLMSKWPACGLATTLVNPGEVPFLGLTIRLTFPEGVRPIPPSVARTPPPALPMPPTAAGMTSVRGFSVHDTIGQNFGLIHDFTKSFSEEDTPDDYTVTAGNAVEVGGIDLGAGETVALPVIPLAVSRPVGTELTIHWTVTGNVAQQHFSGKITRTVTTSTLGAEGLFPKI